MNILHRLRNGRGAGILRASTKLARPLTMLWASAGFASLFGLLAQLLFARRLGAAEYGVVVAANATANIFGPAASFGVGLLWLQKYAEEGWRAQRWARRGFQVALVATALSTVGYAAWCFYAVKDARLLVATLIMAPSVAALGGIQIAESRFQLEERYRDVARWQLLKHLFMLLVALAAAALGAGLMFVAWALSLTSLILAIASFGSAVPLLTGRLDLRGHGVRPADPVLGEEPGVAKIISAAWPYAASGFFYFVFFQSSILVLFHYEGAKSGGVYGVAVTLISAVYLLPRVLFRKLFLAKVSRWYYHERDKLRSRFWPFTICFCLASVPLGLVLAFLSAFLISFAFGNEFQESALVFQIFCVSIPFRFLSTGVGVMSVERDQFRNKIVVQMVVAIFNFAGSVWLVPKYSILGAAWMSVFSEILLCAIYVVMFMRSPAYLSKQGATT